MSHQPPHNDRGHHRHHQADSAEAQPRGRRIHVGWFIAVGIALVGILIWSFLLW